MNDICSILLHVDNAPASAARLEFARQLALRREAALSVMFVAGFAPRSMQLALSESPAALLQTGSWSAAEQASTVFADALARGGPRMRWLDGAGHDVDSFCRQALCADLLVLGQPDLSVTMPGLAPADFVESVVLRTGKPALVLPYTGSFDSMGQRVLIGWNGTPQSARAVACALPWLRAAGQVHVLAPQEHLDGGNGLSIAQHLGCHGIAAKLHTCRSAPAEAGDALLSLAADVDADLLVMGCYGHGRAREFVLGGASRTVLQTMTVPVLMAH